jgi:hypothetical protein
MSRSHYQIARHQMMANHRVIPTSVSGSKNVSEARLPLTLRLLVHFNSVPTDFLVDVILLLLNSCNAARELRAFRQLVFINICVDK